MKRKYINFEISRYGTYIFSSDVKPPKFVTTTLSILDNDCCVGKPNQKVRISIPIKEFIVESSNKRKIKPNEYEDDIQNDYSKKEKMLNTRKIMRNKL